MQVLDLQGFVSEGARWDSNLRQYISLYFNNFQNVANS